jgi:hypothetical protein
MAAEAETIATGLLHRPHSLYPRNESQAERDVLGKRVYLHKQSLPLATVSDNILKISEVEGAHGKFQK